ncbi:Flp pilus assembly protein CpaB [Nocardioides montaniterrae]
MDPRTPLPPRQRLGRLATSVRRAVLRRRRLLAAGLAAVAVGATVHAVAPPAPARTAVTVAAHELPAGRQLEPGDLTTTDLPPGATPDGLAQAPVGRILAAPLTRGEPVTEARLVGPRLADAASGTTALPVRISDPGQAALLTPGDRIDLLATDPQHGSTSTIAEHVEVLAVPPDGDSTGGGSLTGRLVVVGVPSEEVQQVTAAAVVAFVTFAWQNR